jgi:hypothetical protein
MPSFENIKIIAVSIAGLALAATAAALVVSILKDGDEDEPYTPLTKGQRANHDTQEMQKRIERLANKWG